MDQQLETKLRNELVSKSVKEILEKNPDGLTVVQLLHRLERNAAKHYFGILEPLTPENLKIFLNELEIGNSVEKTRITRDFNVYKNK